MPASSTRNRASVIVASGNNSLAERFTGILCKDFDLTTVVSIADAESQIRQSHPQIVIFDSALFGDSLATVIKSTLAVSPQTRVIVLETNNDQPVDQMGLFKSGAHGFCAGTISPDLLLKAAHAVNQGEIWVPRQLISRLIGELAHRDQSGTLDPDSDEAKAVKILTPRELQVAQMVRLGGNNKTIARELEISERTVKAHLSAIFRKLEVQNRLHLALFFKDMA